MVYSPGKKLDLIGTFSTPPCCVSGNFMYHFNIKKPGLRSYMWNTGHNRARDSNPDLSEEGLDGC